MGHDLPWKTGVIRFDLANRRADMLWPFPDQTHHMLHGFAKHPDGEVAVVSRMDMKVYRLGAAGGVTDLEFPVPHKAGDSIVGLAWVGDDLEVVSNGRSQPLLNRHEADGGWISEPLSQPECRESHECTLQAAARESDGWRLWFVHQPSKIAIGDRPEAEIVEVAPGHPPRRMAKFTLDSNRDYYRASDGSGRASRRQFLDRSTGNVVFLAYRDELDEPWELDGDQWRRRTLPEGWIPHAGDHHHREDYVVRPNRLEPLPSWGDNRFLRRVGDRWIETSPRNRDFTLRLVNGQPGPILTSDRWISSRTLIAPANGGGYWLLGAYGTFVKADADLARADAPGFFERTLLLYNNFHHLAWYNDFWLDVVWLKMCILPLLLLFPIIVLAVVVVIRLVRRQRPTGPLVTTLFPYAIAYVLAWGGLGWWFWKLTGYF